MYRDVASGTNRHLDTTFGLQVVEAHPLFPCFLPARASEQGNVIRSVRIYIYVCAKKIVIERTRDLIYLKFVVTDFFPKIISPSAGRK